MKSVRPTAVAGAFYPADSRVLAAEVAALLEGARPDAGTGAPKAIIAPHAGYAYSGAVAASVYALLAPLRSKIRRVVLLGPAHRVWIAGLALPGVSAFASPFGEIEIDATAVEAIAQLP